MSIIAHFQGFDTFVLAITLTTSGFRFLRRRGEQYSFHVSRRPNQDPIRLRRVLTTSDVGLQLRTIRATILPRRIRPNQLRCEARTRTRFYTMTSPPPVRSAGGVPLSAKGLILDVFSLYLIK